MCKIKTRQLMLHALQQKDHKTISTKNLITEFLYVWIPSLYPSLLLSLFSPFLSIFIFCLFPPLLHIPLPFSHPSLPIHSILSCFFQFQFSFLLLSILYFGGFLCLYISWFLSLEISSMIFQRHCALHWLRIHLPHLCQ